MSKLIVVGFDGLDPDLIFEYINDMLNAKKIIEKGVFGRMRTTIPPVTPEARSIRT